MIAYRLLLIGILSITFTNINGAIRFVAESGQGTFDGSTWENALNGNALQTAINSAGTGDSIWVACGTYFPSNTGNRNLSFSMRNDVSIFGSFQGDEDILEDRSFICGPCSILSGDIGTSNVQTDNTYTLVVNNGLNRSAILDGFTIRDGYDDRSVSNIENGLGGGIYNGGNGNGANCSPTFRNLVIINNYATYGAGMFNNGYAGGNSEPLLEQCIIAFNTATIGGGGMDSYGWNNGNVAPILTTCIFYENNSFDRAGGMYCWGGFNGNCSPIITNSAFVNNSSTNIAGALSLTILTI